MADTPDPAVLATAIKDLDDDALAEQIRGIGTDEVLRAIFSGMEEAFVPERAAGVDSTIQYDISTEDGTRTWAVSFANGKCATSEGPATSPRLTLQIGLVDFIRLIFGQAQGPQLFMTGKIKLQGDMMFAMQMQGFFRRDFVAGG
ncbi:MAG TPA: SCP2 sterol-binding domain-containing protein [Actinomycetota bacterium]|nr:SCP2 sterol-binding domain-containing protein [Actinomycetota bacterium]